MPDQTVAPETAPSRPWRPESGLVFAVSDLLSPIFRVPSIELAREMAASAVTAYDPETRADWVNIGRTVAFSMAALTVLGNIASADLPLPDQLKALARACALNRAADESERAMMQRRRERKSAQRTHKPRTPANPPAPEPSSQPELDPETMKAAIAEAMQAFHGAAAPKAAEPAAPQSTRAGAGSNTPPQSTRQPHAVPHPPAEPAAALRNIPGLNPSVEGSLPGGAAAFNPAGLDPMSGDPLQALTARFRQDLLRNSALGRFTERSQVPHA